MITIEYRDKIIEIPINIWNDFEEEQGANLDFLGDETDIILDDEKYNKLRQIAQTSDIAKKLVSELGADIKKSINIDRQFAEIFEKQLNETDDVILRSLYR